MVGDDRGKIVRTVSFTRHRLALLGLGMAIVLTGSIMAGCSSGAAPSTTSAGLAPTTTSATVPVTTATTTGTVATGATEAAPTAVDLHPARQGFSFGYIDKTGKMIISPQYDWARGFSEGLAPVKLAGKWGFIDATGKMVIPPTWDRVGSFSGGLALAQVGDDSEYIDPTGKVVIPPHFAGASSFSEGLAAVALPDDEGGGWAYIDRTGKAIIKGDFAYVGDFSEGLAAVQVNDPPGQQDRQLWGYVDKTGAFVIKPQFWLSPDGQAISPDSDAGSFSEGLAAVPTPDGRRFIDKTGRFVGGAKYQMTGSFAEVLAPVAQDEKSGYIDESGKIVIPFRYQLAMDFDRGIAAVVDENGLMAYIDKTGEYIWRETITVPLSEEERKKLDSLDAAGVLRTYIETSDPWVVYYLSAPHEQAILTNYNTIWGPTGANDIADLEIDGPHTGSFDLYGYPLDEWPDQVQFGVTYDLLTARWDLAMDAGPQTLFAYVGRRSAQSPWRVLGVGTGP